MQSYSAPARRPSTKQKPQPSKEEPTLTNQQVAGKTISHTSEVSALLIATQITYFYTYVV